MRNVGGYLKGTTLEAGGWDLRVSLSPSRNVIGRLADTIGYYLDDECLDTLSPIVALLPHGRFLAGTTLGEGMSTGVDASTVYETARDAWLAAYDMAEREASDERDYQASRCTECLENERRYIGELPYLCASCYAESGDRTLALPAWQ